MPIWVNFCCPLEESDLSLCVGLGIGKFKVRKCFHNLFFFFSASEAQNKAVDEANTPKVQTPILLRTEANPDQQDAP